MQIRTRQQLRIKLLTSAKHQTLRTQLAMLVIFQKELNLNLRLQWIQQLRAIKEQPSLWLTQMALRTKSQLRLWILVQMRIRTHQPLRIKRLNQAINQTLRIPSATSVIFQKALSLNTRHQLTQQLKVTKTLQLSSLTQMVLRTKFQLR